MVKKLKKERDVLKRILNDLGQELKNLRSSKVKLQGQMKGFSDKLKSIEMQEEQLRSKLASTTKKEDLLMKKRISTKDKISQLDGKIKEIKSAERQLTNT